MKHHDWTQGPARWVAAVVLGVACVAGMTWSLAARRPIEPPTLREPVEPAVALNARDSIPSKRPTLGALIDVNTAPAPELQMLPGIGPTLAQRIVDDRAANGPYATLDDLQRVRGIGPRTVEKLADMATTGN